MLNFDFNKLYSNEELEELNRDAFLFGRGLGKTPNYFETKEKYMKYIITIEFKEAYKKIVDYLLKRFLRSNYFDKTKIDEEK